MTEAAEWRPSLGAWIEEDGAHFRVWAPAAQTVTAEIEHAGATNTHTLARDTEGYHALVVPGLGAGARYRYRLDGGEPRPDPASRFQPEGVHGPSELIDPAYGWHDRDWRDLDPDHVVIYEVHIGTFTPQGTYAAAAERLAYLAELGVTVIEVMPLADFAGDRNWGYDGVDLFAPTRAYGRPEDFRDFVDAAHAAGLGVLLDVVYNHFGPAGAYHSQFSPDYFNPERDTPWGAAINLDGSNSAHVRAFFFEQALHWLHEYHVDGFRLDATPMLIDEGEPHFLAEFRDRTAAGRRPGQPPPFLLAEDSRNLALVVTPRAEGGYGFDATYADDFHHEVQRVVTDDHEGYYQDFAGTTEHIARTLEDGWFFTGQFSGFTGKSRGTSPAGLPLPRFMHCLQNHDQIGNRAFGDRLYQQVAAEVFRAALALLLCSAATPTLFMGDEWASTSPFLYFTDHDPELGKLVVEGRRNEFRDWAAFRDPMLRSHIPDPQARATFEASRLDWDEREREPYASTLRYTRALLRLRRQEPAFRWSAQSTQRAQPLGESMLALRRDREGAPSLLLIACLRGTGVLGQHAGDLLAPPAGTRWQRVLSSEDAPFALGALPIESDEASGELWCHFRRPGAILLRAVEADRVA